MIVPPYLKEGDKIRVVAPAGKSKKEFVLPAVEWLRSLGYQAVAGEHVLDDFNQFAGSDEGRLTDLQEALDDSEAKAIICARGGYGTARIADRLDFTAFLKHPKWIAGFSDITVLHNRLNKLGIASIHGPMLRHFPKPGGSISESVKSLFAILKGEKPVYKTEPATLNRPGKAKAELVGGNLSIIYSLTGTPYGLKTDGKILFIEDIGEYLYHTDRMMHSLKLGGKLEHLTGLVVGGFTKMKDNRTAFGMDAYGIISEAVKDYNYPVCFGFPAGHGKKNLALAFGMEWELKVTESGVRLMVK